MLSDTACATLGFSSPQVGAQLIVPEMEKTGAWTSGSEGGGGAATPRSEGGGLWLTHLGRHPVWFCADTCYVLSFAVIMLNTSLHNPNVRDKPGLERFVAMNRGINEGGDLPEELLRVRPMFRLLRFPGPPSAILSCPLPQWPTLLSSTCSLSPVPLSPVLTVHLFSDSAGS